MNIFTANQVNQVYVVDTYNKGVFSKPGETSVTTTYDSTGLEDLNTSASESYASLAAAEADGWKFDLLEGSIQVKTNGDGDMYFVHKGKGGITRSDLVEKGSIMYAKKTTASQMATTTLAARISLNSGAFTTSSGTDYTLPQDYVLNIEFQNPIGMSPDNKYIMTAAVHGTSTMTKAQFYTKLKEVLDKQLKKMGTPLVTVTAASTYVDIVAAEPDWILGIKQQKPVLFTVLNSTVYNDTLKEEVYWADTIYSTGRKTTGGVEPAEETVTSGKPSGTTINNGKLMADFEYFYMGERGDQYRMKTWPDYVPTMYMVVPTHTYDTIGIHFAYVGSNHAVQKSEKDITLIIDTANPVTSTIESAIESAASITI